MKEPVTEEDVRVLQAIKDHCVLVALQDYGKPFHTLPEKDKRRILEQFRTYVNGLPVDADGRVQVEMRSAEEKAMVCPGCGAEMEKPKDATDLYCKTCHQWFASPQQEKRKLVSFDSPEKQYLLWPYLAGLLATGERVVTGTVEAVPIGARVGQVEGRFIRVKRRATREEFVEHAPTDPDDKRLPDEGRAPFYYELELVP